MPDNTTTRRSFLERLLGKEQAGKFEEQLNGLGRVLSAAGIQSKELSKKNKGLLEDMAAEVDTLLAGVTDDETKREGLRNELIAVIMGRLSSMDEPAVVDEPVVEVETMQDGEDEEENAVPMGQVLLELSESFKALSEDNTAIVKDFQELLPVLMDAMKATAAIGKEVSSLKGLNERLSAIEKAIGGKPRQASKDAATEVEVSNQIKAEIEKGTTEQRVLLGVPITREVKYDR